MKRHQRTRNAFAKALAEREFHQRVVNPKKKKPKRLTKAAIIKQYEEELIE